VLSQSGLLLQALVAPLKRVITILRDGASRYSWGLLASAANGAVLGGQGSRETGTLGTCVSTSSAANLSGVAELSGGGVGTGFWRLPRVESGLLMRNCMTSLEGFRCGAAEQRRRRSSHVFHCP
jgi:hypothetical protein